ncbi:hypothetical protein [Actinocorallia sp. A-T 12471]|uniref:hypothetical protein n=1 Tax=Actinocorallia sp. A-T 12471 TaxID=3089813 RepID=UPI0029D05E1A|nr:hypothetical protein [Actinocorallia sp. A-T 12471]MDX6744465.1 hypothetical protein [Actinocorallia sp. A-T 12471]
MNEQGPVTPDTRSRAGLRALWLGLGAVVLTMFIPPAALIIGIFAIIVAVRTRKAAAKGEKTPGVIAGAVFGLFATVFSAASLILSAILWTEINGLNDCKQVVNTRTDERACNDQWIPKIEDKLNIPRGTFEKYGYDDLL